MALAVLVPAFLIVLVALSSPTSARNGCKEMKPRDLEGDPGCTGRPVEEEGESGRFPIELGQPREMLQSKGGRLRVWSEEIPTIRNVHLAMAELELEEDGLLVPQYSDTDNIAYVVQGSAKMGAVIPGIQRGSQRIFIRQVQCGDVVALPKGIVYWWYNDGNEQHRVLFVGDTSFGVNPGRVHQFGLAGSKQGRFGSVLGGFSKDALADAWGIDQKTVDSLLKSQNEAFVVKAKKKIRFPQIPDGRREVELTEDLLQEDEENMFESSSAEASSFEELKYSTRGEIPDFYAKNGGTVTEISWHKLPALRQIGFSAMKVMLQKNAMEAPLFVRNAHQLVYFTHGSGRVQVANGDGRNVFDRKVHEGTVLAIPQFFPSLKIAGDEGLEWISLLTSSSPSFAFLAGKNSVYHGIPKPVVAAAFNVDEEQLMKFGRHEEVIFPQGSQVGRKRQGDGNVKGKGESEEQRRQREEEEERQRECQEEEEQRRQEERRHHREGEEEEEGKGERRGQELAAWAWASLEML